MTEYTKGVWRTEKSQSDSGTSHYQVISAQLGKTVFVADCGADEVGQTNANIICTAINACTELNSNNPMVVAESIGDLYKTLHDLIDLLKNRKTMAFLNSNSLGWSSSFEKAQRAIDKVEGKQNTENMATHL